MTVRPIGEADEEPLGAFLSDLCPEARRLRFFTGGVDLATAAHWAAETASGRYGLLARDDDGIVVGHAVYVQLDGQSAEVAVEIADHLHGRGLGTILVRRLAAIAERRGITRFAAEVLPENRAMLDVFRIGFGAHHTLRLGVETVSFPTSAWRLTETRLAADQARGAQPSSSPPVATSPRSSA